MSTAAPGLEEQLDGLLDQLVEGSFVLTDGQGAVSKWSEPADLLFGRTAPDVLGRAFFDTLIAAPLAPSGEGWRRFLESGSPPGARAKVELHAQHANGHAFVVELVLIPVRLDEGFDFSLFLEDLAFELEPAQMLARLRGQHPVVVRALRTALSEEPMAWDASWRTAGTLIAFRPLCETPWVDAERENRARAANEVEAAMALPEPLPEMDATEAIAGFADASQIVERLLGAVHKLDALEAVAAELPVAVELLGRRAEAAEREARAARSELDRLRPSDLDPAGELRSRIAGLEALDLGAAVREQLGTVAAPLAEVCERLERLEESDPAAEVRERLERLESADPAAEVHERLERLEVAGPPTEVRERLERLESASAAFAGHDQLAELERRQDAILARAEDAQQLAQEALERPTAPAEDPAGHAIDDQRWAELAGALEEGRGEAAAGREALTALEARLHGAADEGERREDALREEIGVLRTRLAGTDALAAEVAGLRGAMADAAEVRGLADGIAELRDQLVELADTRRVSADLADETAVLRDRVDGLLEENAGLYEIVTAVKTDVETLEPATERERRYAELRAELASVTETVRGFQVGFDEARQAAVGARREAEEARRSAAAAGAVTERSAQTLSTAWRELLSPGGGPSDRTVRRLPSRPEPAKLVERPRRAGFDDASAPMAILRLDGHFAELNPKFATLVGYGEHDFTKAVWPSAHDRADYREQQEQLRRMAEGELETVRIRSTYMHQQGLMVPVTGELRLVRDAAGRPEHLLLRAEERAAH